MRSYMHTLFSLKLITSAANAHRNSGKLCSFTVHGSRLVIRAVYVLLYFLMKALICEANELCSPCFSI